MTLGDHAAGFGQRAGHEAPQDPASLDTLRRLLHRRRIAARVFVLLTACCLLLGIPMSILDRRGLAMLLALFGVYFLFLLVDCALLDGWRRRLLRAWQSGDANLAAFAGAIATLPTLPRATLAAMLRSLPILTPVQDRDLAPADRAALAAFSTWRWTEETAAALLPSALLALLSGAGAVLILARAAPDARNGAVMLALLACLLPIRIGIPLWRRGQLAAVLQACKSEAAETLPGLAAGLDWSATTDRRRQRMLRSFSQLLPK